LSAAFIATTIQTQDFPDMEGDRAMGRQTLPIYAHEATRVGSFLAIITWSIIILSYFWGFMNILTIPLSLLGAFIGLRFYFLRTTKSDQLTWSIFTVSLGLPYNGVLLMRWKVLVVVMSSSTASSTSGSVIVNSGHVLYWLKDGTS
jgi:4-hydroxybenzoate polyprenyltransferase